MPSILSESDKDTVKRSVPKSANKIQAVAVARLFVAYPNKQRWVYTGLQGAAVLANDLVGNTFWLKMVDISGTGRGVIWDQEIYDPFYYNQDRTFFHSFELEDCLAGFSFVSEKEAKQFKKKMDEREKNASKETRATPFQGAIGHQPTASSHNSGGKHHRFGLGNLLGHTQRSSSAPHIPPAVQPQPITPPSAPTLQPPNSNRDRASSLDTVDPSWRGILGELLEMGITEDQIEQNSDFIKDYIEQRKASGDPIPGTEDSTVADSSGRQGRGAPPPPPVSATSFGRMEGISSQDTGGTASSRRGPAPAPPPTRRSRTDNQSTSSAAGYQPRPPSPTSSPVRTPSPPRAGFQFRAPPPLADAGKFAGAAAPPKLPGRPRATSNVVNPGPPPPPRPPKTPMEDEVESKPKFGVPPPFYGERNAAAPPPPPPRAAAQAASPRISRETSQAHTVPPASVPPPPLPPKQTSAASVSGPPPPPPLPAVRSAAHSPPPPPLPNVPRPVPNAPATSGAPPPPPLPPPSGAPLPPPPPPVPSLGGAPPPPLPSGGSAPPLPKPSGGNGDLLASIRGSGGIGGGGLKKVSDQDKRDRSSAAVPGAAPAAPAPGGAPPPPSGGGGLGDALAAALSQRNKKVSASDDEDEDDDDWDDEPKAKKHR